MSYLPARSLSYDPSYTPKKLLPLLQALSAAYPISASKDAAKNGLLLQFAKGPATQVGLQVTGNTATISSGTLAGTARGIGALLAGMDTLEEASSFTSFGIMLDCSRNAVMTVKHLKKWMRQLSLFGCNMIMLYTEDTYSLPDEPWFGFMRGPYTAEEIQEIDDYAAKLGIEIVPCIQTLGHLAQVLRWGAYAAVKDTASVLLSGTPETNLLLDKMLDFWSQNVRSRRIHIGQDEAHDMGFGRHLKLHGLEDRFDLFNRQLKIVVEKCKARGLQPMIWSDMYYRIATEYGDYYDPNIQLRSEVKAAIPPEVDLVYWDYYHDDPDFYHQMIKSHQELNGRLPIMGSGVWTWGNVFWYNRDNTERNGRASVVACREAGVKDFFLTMWGDDGAYCEYDSSLAGIAYLSELAWTGADTLDERAETQLAARFQAAVGADYHQVIALSNPTAPHFTEATLIWDDPLLGKFRRSMTARHGAEIWTELREKLDKIITEQAVNRDITEPVDLAHGIRVLEFLRARIYCMQLVDQAYAQRDLELLKQARQAIESTLTALDALRESFRRQWLRRNKALGLETMQIRLGGSRARFEELARRLDELAAGEIDTIEELEVSFPEGAQLGGSWRDTAAGSIIL